MVSFLYLWNQYSVKPLSLAKISRIDWKSKIFRGFRIFLLSYRVKTKTRIRQNFPKKVNSSQKKMTRATSFEKKSIVKSFNFEKLAKIWGKRGLLKYWICLILDSWKLSCFGRKTSKWYPFSAPKISIVLDFSVWQKSPELIVNLKISADSAFSLWAIEQKRKRGIGGISRKG